MLTRHARERALTRLNVQITAEDEAVIHRCVKTGQRATHYMGRTNKGSEVHYVIIQGRLARILFLRQKWLVATVTVGTPDSLARDRRRLAAMRWR